MPDYRFRWDAFDPALPAALARAHGYDASAHGGSPTAWLADNGFKRPNERLLAGVDLDVI